jgi:hypothetical protein
MWGQEGVEPIQEILVKNPPFSPRVSGGVGGYLSLGEVEIKETE